MAMKTAAIIAALLLAGCNDTVIVIVENATVIVDANAEVDLP